MKSVLYIGVGAPWLGGAGFLVRQRMFLRALAEVASLELAMFDFPSTESVARPVFARRVTPLSLPSRRSFGRLGLLAADLYSPSPRMFRGCRVGCARSAIARLDPGRFDAVFAFRIEFAHFAGVLGHPRLLLDVDDPEHLRRQRQLAVTCDRRGDWRTRLDLRKLSRFEKAAVAGTMASFACQGRDAAAFRPTPVLVPNCVEVPAACPARRAGRPRLVFLGNLDDGGQSPNRDALLWFIDRTWPAVHAAVPGAELHVIGRTDSTLAQQLRARPGVIAAGFVADLGAALAEASLSVAPIRFGTGTRIKILESFANGCPVVSTTLGCEGIDVIDGQDILVADTPDAFALRCIGLLNDRAAQQRLGFAGYELVAARYNERARQPWLAATLARLLDRATTGGGDGPTSLSTQMTGPGREPAERSDPKAAPMLARKVWDGVRLSRWSKVCG